MAIKYEELERRGGWLGTFETAGGRSARIRRSSGPHERTQRQDQLPRGGKRFERPSEVLSAKLRRCCKASSPAHPSTP
ncbi:hypothetical protein HPP92_002787 [Vanilla planifolia]|uniref:Uncharacterized protein n=1 Tax=Vanilla planifolia TaxID=51239 RepID=A0A835RTM4_VANPL|nr:hypothetical protein HPP92_002787 [Vanilla planifolia]